MRSDLNAARSSSEKSCGCSQVAKCVGVALGQNRFLAGVVQPYVKVMNAIPRIVLGALFTVALGLGTGSKVLLAAVLVFFVVFLNAYQSVREVDQNLLRPAPA